MYFSVKAEITILLNAVSLVQQIRAASMMGISAGQLLNAISSTALELMTSRGDMQSGCQADTTHTQQQDY